MLTRQIRWALRSIFRSFGRTLAAITVMAVTIFLVGATLLLGIAGTNFGKTAKERFTLPVELKVEADSTVANNLATQIQEMPGVKEVQINNPDDVMVELADYLNMNSDDIVNSIGYNPLQWELVVIPENPEDISSLAEEISKFTVVDKVIFEEEVIDKFTNLFVIFQWIAAGLAVLAIMVTMVVIGSIIALSVASRKEEIEVMSLVGAPPSTIIGPYLIEGIFYGVIGGGLAAAAIWFGWGFFQNMLARVLPWFDLRVQGSMFILIVVGVVAFGFLTGLLSSWRASATHLGRIKA
ncbi:MAG TPA: ABC transporter permease [Caldisericia bacterium]|nr:ABC transporter permease [Caldisericia bacterium]HPF48946.1 ABC transporter permease [Caldisericia bacterium]HPI83190.1 ABC transporter permease [Caldisericia bacterium]HPQ92417.1 ABC transporter permease [Caldisericia bacterium]HRV74485.1 ABC transporter permease [Caldisericia bacterium]